MKVLGFGKMRRMVMRRAEIRKGFGRRQLGQR
jgi:hypothetical protein